MAQLGDTLQRAAVAIYLWSPTVCTTCFHVILKSALPAQEPTPSVPATVPSRPATGHATSRSLDNGSTSDSPNNGSNEATVEDPDAEFAPLRKQVFLTCKLASDAARTVDGCFVANPTRQSPYACSCEGCDTKWYVRHEGVAGRWTTRQIGLHEYGANSAYLEGKSLYLPLYMTLKLKDLPRGNCPQRALALMQEAFPSDPMVGKMLAKWNTNWNAVSEAVPLCLEVKGSKVNQKPGIFLFVPINSGHFIFALISDLFKMRILCQKVFQQSSLTVMWSPQARRTCPNLRLLPLSQERGAPNLGPKQPKQKCSPLRGSVRQRHHDR